jgi:hypothetical protein
MGGTAGDQRSFAAAMSLTATGRATREGNAMGRSTEDWQSYHLGERIIHTPAVHGAGWQALGWQRLNGLDAPMPPAEAREEALTTPAIDADPVVIDGAGGEEMTATAATATATAAEGDGGAVSVSEAMQDAEAEPSMLMPATEAMAAAVEEPTAGSADGMDLQAMTKAAIITAMQQRHGVLLDRGLSKSALLAAARELEQADQLQPSTALDAADPDTLF